MSFFDLPMAFAAEDDMRSIPSAEEYYKVLRFRRDAGEGGDAGGGFLDKTKVSKFKATEGQLCQRIS